MLNAMIAVLVIAILAALFYWIIDAIPVQQPINRWAKIAIVFIAVIALVWVLLGLGGINLGRLGWTPIKTLNSDVSLSYSVPS